MWSTGEAMIRVWSTGSILTSCVWGTGAMTTKSTMTRRKETNNKPTLSSGAIVAIGATMRYRRGFNHEGFD